MQGIHFTYMYTIHSWNVQERLVKSYMFIPHLKLHTCKWQNSTTTGDQLDVTLLLHAKQLYASCTAWFIAILLLSRSLENDSIDQYPSSIHNWINYINKWWRHFLVSSISHRCGGLAPLNKLSVSTAFHYSYITYGMTIAVKLENKFLN